MFQSIVSSHYTECFQKLEGFLDLGDQVSVSWFISIRGQDVKVRVAAGLPPSSLCVQCIHSYELHPSYLSQHHRRNHDSHQAHLSTNSVLHSVGKLAVLSPTLLSVGLPPVRLSRVLTDPWTVPIGPPGIRRGMLLLFKTYRQ